MLNNDQGRADALFGTVLGALWILMAGFAYTNGWLLGITRPYLWNYGAAAILTAVIPAVLAVVYFSGAATRLIGKPPSYPFVAWLAFSPFFLYFGFGFFLIDRFGENVLANPGPTSCPNICVGSASGAMIDLFLIVAYVAILIAVPVIGTLIHNRRIKNDSKMEKWERKRAKRKVIAMIIIVAILFAGSISIVGFGIGIPKYGVHLTALMVNPYINTDKTNTYDYTIIPTAQGRAGGQLANCGKFLEILQIYDNRSSPAVITTLNLEPKQSGNFEDVHSPLNDSAAYEIYPGINYIDVYMRAPCADNNSASFVLEMYIG